METLNLVQGSDKWLAERRECRTASEAPAMMGENPNTTRDELLAEKKTGIVKEVSQYTKDVVFNKGHIIEAIAQPMAEKIIGEELFPKTGKLVVDGVTLLASFDGLDMMDSTPWECKQGNQEKIALVNDGTLPSCDKWQVVQQCVVSEAKKCLYMVADIDIKMTPPEVKSIPYMWYTPTDEDKATLIAGWKQFDKDLETFEVPETVVVPAAKPIEALPTLSVQVQGSITKSNLEVFNNSALEFIENINTDLKTDEDFGKAELTVKFCGNAEKELENVKAQILGQTADIDHVFKTIDHLSESMRVKRLQLEKLVKSQKTLIKSNIVNEAKEKFADHIYELSQELEHLTINVVGDFAGAIKGKRNLDSMRNAANTELAQCKIKADQIAEVMKANLAVINDKATEHRALFADLQEIITKPTDDFTLVVASRIGEHEKAEKEKLESLRAQAVIDAQKIVDEKNAEDEKAKETVAVTVPGKTKKIPAEPESNRDVDELAKYIQAISSVETPILLNPELQETLNINALMIGKAINNLYEAIAESKAA